jgi:hypothetical protein
VEVREPTPATAVAPLLAGFEAIDRGRRILESRTSSALDRRTADDLIWAGNVQLLAHEQRAVVQPNFDHLTCAFARLFSMGSTLNFEVRGLRRDFRTSPRSTSTRSPAAFLFVRTRGRGSPASTIAGAGS